MEINLNIENKINFNFEATGFKSLRLSLFYSPTCMFAFEKVGSRIEKLERFDMCMEICFEIKF